MTDEEMRRTVEFILQQQAQFTADMLRMSEENARFAAETRQNFGRLGEAVIAITGILGRLGDGQERLERAQELTEKRVAELAAAQTALAQAQARTDERLNTFIGVVERYISEHRNGKE